MKGLALLIGNSNYEQTGNFLKNPINDAKDFSEKLKQLGYIVRCLVDVTQQKMDEEIIRFGEDLDKFDIGIFYFAGHGMQIDGENYVTATNTNFESEISAKFSSIILNKVLAYMDKAKNDTNILILDACRDNPYEKSWNRSISNQGLAPMYAPKGTLIAYATSPGEKAKDGIGNNGLYTSALLKHIEDRNITIEEFFKRVRNSVYAFSNGKQTSWEHTSLTGTFIFNSGNLIHSFTTKYTDDVISDKDFKLNGSKISNIIRELKTYNWYKQSPAIYEIENLKPENLDKNELFLLGRNFLQTADGGENQANYLMGNLDSLINKFSSENENPFLDGILFEIYFDSSGIFRGENLKNTLIENVIKLSNNPLYKNSFDFIDEQLKPFIEDIFFIPKSKNQSISFDIIFEKIIENGNNIYSLKDIKYEGNSIIFKDERYVHFNSNQEIYYEPILYHYLKGKIATMSSVPFEYLTITSNFDSEIDINSRIMFPIGYKIAKKE